MLFVASALAAAPGPHAAQVEAFGHTAPPSLVRSTQPPPPTPGPDLRVYGYLAWWAGDLPSVPWDELSDVALFAVEANADGTLGDTGPWASAADAVALAEPYGVRVDLVVNNFDTPSMTTLLGSAASRATLVEELATWVDTTGAHGVNVDFEGLPASAGPDFVALVAELAAVVPVTVAVPAVDWVGAFDHAALTEHADLFVMGYDYHWSGSTHAGPVDPLRAGPGTVWAGVQSASLTGSVADVLAAGADPSRVVLGLPLYGRAWPVAADAVPAEATDRGGAVLFAEAWQDAAQRGATLEPDAYAMRSFDGERQTWFGDVDTVRERIRFVREETELAGIGFWALHYDDDDPAFWAMVREGTTRTDPLDTGEPPVAEERRCGCDPSGGGPGPWALPALALLLLRRRAR